MLDHHINGSGQVTPSDLKRLIERVSERYLVSMRAAYATLAGRSETLDRPALAPNVQLSGELMQSGYQDRQWLIQRDGTFIQVTELLYRVLELANGERALDDIAVGVSTAIGRPVSARNVRQIMERKLIPAGLVVDRSEPAARPPGSSGAPSRRSPLTVNLRMRMLGPGAIEPVARVLQVLYWPPVLVATVASIIATHVWLYASYGVDSDLMRLAVANPELVGILLGLLVMAAMFHEFGHAAALRYGGGQVRGIGAGLYLFYPVFYTDVTDAYRLGRWARVRTDLGGFYFHLIFAVGMIGLYAAIGQDVLLLVVVLINLEILRQSLPFLRLDGYWTLADLTGIPDLFSQIGPYLRALLPARKLHGQRLPPLKRWVAVVFGVYIVVTIPALVLALAMLTRGMPGTLAAAWNTGLQQWATLVAAQRVWDLPTMIATALQLFMLMLTMFGLGFMLVMFGRLGWRALWAIVLSRLARACLPPLASLHARGRSHAAGP